ncbi:MAG: hypothetical protein FWD69_08135 [Polyangiaceae bacterium]|nr:hypothetical protein [Polyangiaceae bacterium]
MQGSTFEEEDFFRAIQTSGARVLLIGRRALVALGAPLLTADYDLWLHIDDIEKFNECLGKLDLDPNRSPDEARKVGRYVLEGDERVDILVARAAPTKDGVVLTFDQAYRDHQSIRFMKNIDIAIPSLEHLILTKRWSMRPRDLPDINFLETLKNASTQGQGSSS